MNADLLADLDPLRRRARGDRHAGAAFSATVAFGALGNRR